VLAFVFRNKRMCPMQPRIFLLFLLATAFSYVGTPQLSGQELPTPPPPFKRIFTVIPLKGGAASAARMVGLATSGSSIPLWSYSVVSLLDGATYSGQMVGRSPFFHGYRTTTIQVDLIPVILTFAGTGTVFDPTLPDPCLSNNVVLGLVQNSPIFQNSAYVMNGADVGSTQYVDAFQRANFWSNVSVAGNSYHTLLSLTTLSAVAVTVPAANGQTNSAPCGHFGNMDINWWDAYVQTTLISSLATQGVSPTVLPVFLFDSVVMFQNGSPTQCCVLGYHGAYVPSASPQTYAVVDFDTSGAFGGDISVMSHEVGEWMDDPLGTNLTPAWGKIGQVSGCQNDLEVGDPLTGTFLPQVSLNGFSYTLQELAFFSWFYRQSPSIGSGGLYSDNATFTTGAGPVCM
jgi:hypothetical protein